MMLESMYYRAVRHRSPKKYRIKAPDRKKVEEVAQDLDEKFCVLFIEAQFWAMPPAFCQRVFRSDSPPATAVFGGNCRLRYVDYTDKGLRTPAW